VLAPLDKDFPRPGLELLQCWLQCCFADSQVLLFGLESLGLWVSGSLGGGGSKLQVASLQRARGNPEPWLVWLVWLELTGLSVSRRASASTSASASALRFPLDSPSRTRAGYSTYHALP
jgi:hypothetical protein